MSAYALELFGHVRRIRTEDAQYFVKEVALGEAIRRHIKRAGVVLAENLRRVLILQRAIMHPQTQPLPYPPFHKLIGCLLATENRQRAGIPIIVGDSIRVRPQRKTARGITCRIVQRKAELQQVNAERPHVIKAPHDRAQRILLTRNNRHLNHNRRDNANSKAYAADLALKRFGLRRLPIC